MLRHEVHRAHKQCQRRTAESISTGWEFVDRKRQQLRLTILITDFGRNLIDYQCSTVTEQPPRPCSRGCRAVLFDHNFVIFQYRWKRIAFSESADFSTCVQKLSNFGIGHVTTFLFLKKIVSSKRLTPYLSDTQRSPFLLPVICGVGKGKYTQSTA